MPLRDFIILLHSTSRKKYLGMHACNELVHQRKENAKTLNGEGEEVHAIEKSGRRHPRVYWATTCCCRCWNTA